MGPSQFTGRVQEHRALGNGYFALRIANGPDGRLRESQPGQFVMLRGDWDRDPILPRAFSIMDVEADGSFWVLAKVAGRGTLRLSRLTAGDALTVTGPLGKPFAPASSPEVRRLLVAGGVGLPPLYFVCAQAQGTAQASCLELFYGGRSAADLVLLSELGAMGIGRMELATEDGSVGHEGFVTGALERRIARAQADGEAIELLACGPTGMLEAVRRLGLATRVPTWLCLETEMACGFGVCLGCAVPVHGARPYRYCCTEGPVFRAEEVRWS